MIVMIRSLSGVNLGQNQNLQNLTLRLGSKWFKIPVLGLKMAHRGLMGCRALKKLVKVIRIRAPKVCRKKNVFTAKKI
jgi:hypothetical protein